MQILEAMVFHEEWPAGEPAADASLQPRKGIFMLAAQRKNTSDLVIRMVRMPK